MCCKLEYNQKKDEIERTYTPLVIPIADRIFAKAQTNSINQNKQLQNTISILERIGEN